MNNNHHDNKFFEGLLWGAILGGGIVFLMGTKKGKKLLKAITEEGMDGLSGFMDGVDEFEEEIEEEEEVEARGNGVKEEKVVESKPAARKRFFRKRTS